MAKYRISHVPDGNRFLLCAAKNVDELTLWLNYDREEISLLSESTLRVRSV